MAAHPLELLRHNLDTLLLAIEDCRMKKQVLPTLVLLYSGIDVVASLERGENENVGTAFRRWAQRYMLDHSELQCTSHDLWGARCGIVHAYTAESDLSRAGRAKRVLYAWGTASADDLAELIRAIDGDHVAVHVDGVVDSIRSGVSKFLRELAEDAQRVASLSLRTDVWFTNLDKTVGEEALKLIRRRPGV